SNWQHHGPAKQVNVLIHCLMQRFSGSGQGGQSGCPACTPQIKARLRAKTEKKKGWVLKKP
ncbi:MAG: hypothetical protein ACK55I_49100, partial [bacterium]